MLCSICKKTTAIVFTNKIENGKQELEGLCFGCAKERGINPLDVLVKQSGLSEKDLEEMNSQLENLFTEMSENMPEEELNDESSPFSMFSNFFGGRKNQSSEPENEDSKKRIKTEKKPNVKKKKILDLYGTNLTQKARNNELDLVIGRDMELERMIQILNRRSKNNPVLIGEPGVGKTAVAQGLAIRIANRKCSC